MKLQFKYFKELNIFQILKYLHFLLYLYNYNNTDLCKNIYD